MSNPAVYIRNSDQSKFSTKDYDIHHQGVLLTRYRGTRTNALRKKVPLFMRNGTYVGNLDSLSNSVTAKILSRR